MTAIDNTYEDTPLPMPDLDVIPEEYRKDVRDLFDTWHSVRGRNLCLTELYRMHNKIVDLGVIDMPVQLATANEVVGWPTKAVNVMAVRSKFDGFVFSGAQNADLDAICRINNMRSKYTRACKGSLVHGLSAFTVMKAGNSVKVRSYSANQCAIKWDKDEERIACGVVLAQVDDNGTASRYVVHEPSAVLTIDRVGENVDRTGKHVRWVWKCEGEKHAIGRPLMQPLVFDADDDRPLGHSRITPEVISITEKAMRDVLNMDVASAFWAFPQRYMLGVDRGLFADDVVGRRTVEDEDGNVYRLRTRMETYLGRIMAISRDNSGEVPQVGQFQPLDITNLVHVFENDAQRFSGATHVPLAQLGVLSNTYTSSDALGAANDPLILDVETMNVANGEAMAGLARLILCVKRNCTEDDLGVDEQSVDAYFQDPSQPTLAARADGWTKLASSDKSIVGTRVWYEGLGFKQATIDRLNGEKDSASATQALGKIAEAVAGGGAAGAGDGPTRRATMYEITSILGQYKRGQLTKGNALRMLQYIGVDDGEANRLINDVDDGTVSEKAGEDAGGAGADEASD